ncbi:NAD(P)H-binding protein [Mycolicibacterium sp. HS_4_1]
MTAPERSILVFGATGALGRHVLAGLDERHVPPGSITAVGRNQERLDELAAAGFGVAAVDLADTGKVAELVARHRNIVLISGSDPDRLAQHLSVIEAAKRAGVAHFYYTSGLRADDDRFRINADHKATEDALTASGLTHTILRNTWYIENYQQSLDGPRHTGILAAATGDAVVAAATRKDLGEALAVVITTDGHDNLTYHLNGDTNFTYADIADAMSTVVGRDVTYQPVTARDLQAMLTSDSIPAELAEFLVDLDTTIAAGAYAKLGDDLTTLLGRPTAGLIDGLHST